MKSYIRFCLIWTCVLMLFFSNAGFGTEFNTGVGIILGEPTGISVKKWLNSKNAIDAGLAWSLGSEGGFHFHVDYLFHKDNVVRTVELRGRTPVYYGFGLRLSVKNKARNSRSDDNNAHFGVRFPVGLSYSFYSKPFDVFIELVPIFDLAPDTELNFNAGIGGRFYF